MIPFPSKLSQNFTKIRMPIIGKKNMGVSSLLFLLFRTHEMSVSALPLISDPHFIALPRERILSHYCVIIIIHSDIEKINRYHRLKLHLWITFLSCWIWLFRIQGTFDLVTLLASEKTVDQNSMKPFVINKDATENKTSKH